MDYARDLRRDHQYVKALEQYEKMAVRFPGQLKVPAQRVNTLREMGLHDKALLACDEMLRHSPRYLNGHLQRLNILRELKRFDEAISYAKELETQFPVSVDVAVLASLVMSETGRWSEAINQVERAIVIAPKQARLWIRKINLLRRMDQQADALATAERAVQNIPRNGELWLAFASLAQDALGVIHKIPWSGGKAYVLSRVASTLADPDIHSALRIIGTLETAELRLSALEPFIGRLSGYLADIALAIYLEISLPETGYDASDYAKLAETMAERLSEMNYFPGGRRLLTRLIPRLSPVAKLLVSNATQQRYDRPRHTLSQ
jgi:tetratricopeptide (TPR) repeat protein